MKILAKAAIPFVLISCATSKPIEISRDKTDLGTSAVYSFIGKKVAVEEFDPNNLDEGYIVMDLAYRATYEVVEQYTGQKLPRVVQFEAYDHYGFPQFAKHQNALIYLKEYNGELFHIKYTFDVVRYTDDYGWVTCGVSTGWKDKVIIPPVKIRQGWGCKEGNLAENVATSRVLSGDVK